jgi:predicted nucleic acid-binding protein
MRAIFADTGYWVAVIHPRDALHKRAMVVSQQLGQFTIITSEMVLVEVLNMFSRRGAHLRDAATKTVQAITSDPSIEVVPQTRRLFREALDLYQSRADKEWSLTDCASFVIMRQRNINEALTDDHHFTQNGYKALLKA